MNELSSQVFNKIGADKWLILGIGNPILSDDGVGIHVVRKLQKKYSNVTSLEFDELSTGGLSLAERFIGYKKVIIIDALALENGIPGEIHKLSIDEFKSTIHTYCVHDCNLPTAFDILKKELEPDMLPEEVLIIGIEAKNFDEFSETLSPEVEKAVPKAISLVEDEIRKIIPNEIERK
ncbi:MAG: hydrogenase maturation protease [Candidatus Heimdallarchaeota archaeon]|nr:hydrogenase maturation protease [Candidatus Heimdallarchaeota archaeon]